MPSTTDYGDLVSGKLAARLLTAVTSGATVTVQSVNGSAITWPTGAHRLKLLKKTRTGIEFETIGVASATQSGSTVTLGTLTRQLSMTDGSTFSSGGDGRTFPANTDVYLSWDIFDAERTMKDDKVNTITGAGAIRGSSTTVALIRPNSVTEAQRDLISAGNGDTLYVTTGSNANRIQTYEGGAWGAAGSTTVADGSTTVAGKFEEATSAEVRAETATGGTGAGLVIPASSTVVLKDDRIVLKDATELTIATGAITVTQPYHSVDTEADAASDDLDTITAAVGVGEIIVLVANNTARTVVVKHNTGNIKLADATDFSLDDTEKSITLLKQTSNWIEISRGRGASTSTNYSKVVHLGAADTAGVGTSSTAEVDVPTHQYTITANDLISGVGYRFIYAGTINWGVGTANIRVRLGSTNIFNFSPIPTVTTEFLLWGEILGTGAAGASVEVRGTGQCRIATGSTIDQIDYGAANVATNGSLVLKLNIDYTTSNGSNSFVSSLCRIEKFSTTAF